MIKSERLVPVDVPLPAGRRKRRWLQFRLRTMMLLTALVACFFGWPHLHRQWAFWQLQNYIGASLRDLPEDESERLDRWVACVVQSGETGLDWTFRPQTKLIHRAHDGSRLHIVQVQHFYMIPGNDSVRVCVLGPHGRMIRIIEFDTENRTSVRGAFMDETAHGFVCLVIETAPQIYGDASRQYYRVTDEELEFLRSERIRSTGAVEYRTDYAPRITDWAMWPQWLASTNQLDQLRGLAAFWSWENRQNLGAVDDETVRHFERLSRSDHPWIREEATLALQWLDDRSAFSPPSRVR